MFDIGGKTGFQKVHLFSKTTNFRMSDSNINARNSIINAWSVLFVFFFFKMFFSTCKVSNPLSEPLLNWWWWWCEGSEHRITRPTTTPSSIIVRIVPRRRTKRIENPSSAISRSCLIGYPTFLQRKVILLVRKLQYKAYPDKPSIYINKWGG